MDIEEVIRLSLQKAAEDNKMTKDEKQDLLIDTLTKYLESKTKRK